MSSAGVVAKIGRFCREQRRRLADTAMEAGRHRVGWYWTMEKHDGASRRRQSGPWTTATPGGEGRRPTVGRDDEDGAAVERKRTLKEDKASARSAGPHNQVQVTLCVPETVRETVLFLASEILSAKQIMS